MLEISRELLDVIRAEAAKSPKVEVCGLLLGEGMRVDEVRSCRNVAIEPATGFQIDPQSLIGAHKAARGGGPSVIGYFHSHPTGQAEPSARDAAAARSGEVWMIVSRREIGAWLAVGDSTFEHLACVPEDVGRQTGFWPSREHIKD